jgi:DNA primase
MVDPDGIRAVHGRYLEVPGRLGKMLTVGDLGGVVVVGDGWRADPVVLVEGLFDALSVATCGGSAVATIGRWAPFLVDALAGRRVWLALDATRPGDAEAARIAGLLPRSEVRRIRPPGRSKDWNTALVERGRAAVRKALEGR